MTIYGWDQSHFDAPGIGAAVAEGISFITHKAGGDKNDAEIGAWWNGVRGLDPDRVLLGAYWVLYPGSPSARADAFLARLDATCPGWRDRPFLLQVDCEKWNGDPSTMPGKADIRAFCDRLVARMPRLRPMVYAPAWAYGDSLTGLGYPLWSSRYVTGTGGFRALYPGDGSAKWTAYSGQVPAILQYSSSAVIGGQTTCDANAYRGTLAELIALAAPGWSTDMDLTPENLKAIAGAVWGNDVDPSAGGYTASGALWTVLGRTGVIDDIKTKVDAVATQAATPVDVNALAALVSGSVTASLLAALAPEVIAALPADFTEQVANTVVNMVAARLAS